MINYFRLWYRYFQVEVLSVPGRVIALLFFLTLLVLPIFSHSPQMLRILILASIYAIYAVSWDLLAGYTGQISLGHGLFFGVAGYSAALFNTLVDFGPWLTIPLGALFAVAVGLIVGIPALRLRGFYLALVTLAFPIILTGIIYVFPDFTGGELGLFGISRLARSRVLNTYIVYAIMIFSIFAMFKLSDAKSKIVRTGLVFQAIREDEISARKSGIYTVKYKLLAFSVSAFFAGIAGGLYAHFIKIVGPLHPGSRLFISSGAVGHLRWHGHHLWWRGGGFHPLPLYGDPALLSYGRRNPWSSLRPYPHPDHDLHARGDRGMGQGQDRGHLSPLQGNQHCTPQALSYLPCPATP